MKVLIGLLTLLAFNGYANDSVKGKCTSLNDSKYSLEFELIQTNFTQQTYQIKGTRKAFISRKKFELDSSFLGVYRDQFYSFAFATDFIKESTNLLIKKEEFRKSPETDEAFIVSKDGYILDSLSCADLNN